MMVDGEMPGSMMRPGRSWARRVAELWLLSITKQSSVFVAGTNLTQNPKSEPGSFIFSGRNFYYEPLDNLWVTFGFLPKV
jgi:hypothetical protein